MYYKKGVCVFERRMDVSSFESSQKNTMRFSFLSSCRRSGDGRVKMVILDHEGECGLFFERECGVKQSEMLLVNREKSMCERMKRILPRSEVRQGEMRDVLSLLFDEERSFDGVWLDLMSMHVEEETLLLARGISNTVGLTLSSRKNACSSKQEEMDILLRSVGLRPLILCSYVGCGGMMNMVHSISTHQKKAEAGQKRDKKDQKEKKEKTPLQKKISKNSAFHTGKTLHVPLSIFSDHEKWRDSVLCERRRREEVARCIVTGRFGKEHYKVRFFRPDGKIHRKDDTWIPSEEDVLSYS